MDKWQAIHEFWSGFDIPAFNENSVPEKIYDAESGQMRKLSPPYITYSAATANIGNFVALSGSIWYRSESWEEISKKADEISGALKKILRLDDGYLFLTRGSPFAQRMTDEDETIKRIYINIGAEFYTEY